MCYWYSNPVKQLTKVIFLLIFIIYPVGMNEGFQ